ncbi:hypothetical protein EYF80_000803 [Liparis tanakae]|uniref:Uncharacterized protein n=1 Tax=Liparis tanakae TaxID=230148 RepID=A0A4Z2JF95_9TELE|nr:hypothetical protein EYF80_000803 [Liparis tanakae]
MVDDSILQQSLTQGSTHSVRRASGSGVGVDTPGADLLVREGNKRPAGKLIRRAAEAERSRAAAPSGLRGWRELRPIHSSSRPQGIWCCLRGPKERVITHSRPPAYGSVKTLPASSDQIAVGL